MVEGAKAFIDKEIDYKLQGIYIISRPKSFIEAKNKSRTTRFNRRVRVMAAEFA